MYQRSFIKWVGGKYRSLYQILDLLPSKYKTYYEPFLGSGVVYFNVCPHEAVLNDVERNLVTTFRGVKRDPEGVCKQLDLLDNSSDSYYGIRQDFNDNSFEVTSERAAQFIYINKCGYNGLYRVNRRGYVNVAYGKKEGDPHKDFTVVRTCSALLQNARIMNTDYKDILSMARRGDFVYLDPPYHKEFESSYTGYNPVPFSEEDHIELAEECQRISNSGVMFALSNSNTELVNRLYRNFYITAVYTARTVSVDVSSRMVAKEVLVTNYQK